MTTALQITNFNFYGDELIALKDNSTAKFMLQSIQFLKELVSQIKTKFAKDVTNGLMILLSQRVYVYLIYLLMREWLKKTPPMNYQETYCISQRKLPIALAKINITPKMKQAQPELASKLELYQDKCADVLASIFIDKKTTSDINSELLAETISNAITLALQPVYEKISNIEEQSNKKNLPERKYSRWKTNTFNKLNTLLSYVNKHSDENLNLSDIIHLIIVETEDTYNIEVNDYVDAYKSEFGLTSKPYTLDAIDRYKEIRDMFTLTLDSIMAKLHITEKSDKIKHNIFDELAAQLETE